MHSYPSIPGVGGNNFFSFDAYVFSKLDGSNLRFEWSKKQGWHKFGTRNTRFDESDPDFGSSIGLLHKNLSGPLEKIFKKQRWNKVVIFVEFWGENSFAGLHNRDDEKYLSLFDVYNYEKKGFVAPKEFIKLFDGKMPTAEFLGRYRWNREFVESVYRGDIKCAFEGVVGKGSSNGRIVRAKAKTSKWIEKVKALYSDKADNIISS